jgi:serine/threonine protein kinase
LGEGGFGVVKKAISAKEKTRELAVKIVPYGGDPVKREKTEKEINIIRILPDHPNLVRVIPLKCFSDNNFYIFMELCGDGTLSDLVSKPGLP